MSEDKDAGKVAWNSSEYLIQEISGKRSAANNAKLSSNFKKAFGSLQAIRETTVQSISPTDLARLEDLEKRFEKFEPYLSNSHAISFNKNVRKAFEMAVKSAKNIYNEYNTLLMKILNEKGYLVTEKQDSSRMNFGA